MAIDIVKGQDKTIIVGLKQANSPTNRPFDLTSVQLINACFKTTGASDVEKFYYPFTGNTTSASDIVSNIADTQYLMEGQPISGAGIPVGATILKTPASTTNPTAAGTVKISLPATATATGVSLLEGDILINGNPILGEITINLDSTETDSLDGTDFQVKVIKSSIVSYCQFLSSLNIIDRVC